VIFRSGIGSELRSIIAETRSGNAEWKRSGNGMVFQSGIGSELRSIIAEMRNGSGVEMGWCFRVESDQSCGVLLRKRGAEMRSRKQKEETRKWSDQSGIRHGRLWFMTVSPS
jgi:folate-dependent phosphoribosylglycinamide formyltransferase PurN